MVNYNLFNKATRGLRVELSAEMLGLDADDFKDSSPYDKVMQINTAREYMRGSMEKKDNNYTIPEIPKLEVTKYRKAGVDEYRRLHWKKNGINKSTVKDYKFGDFISAEDLFKKSNFAKEQMPAIYEDEYGNVWERLVEEGK